MRQARFASGRARNGLLWSASTSVCPTSCQISFVAFVRADANTDITSCFLQRSCLDRLVWTICMTRAVPTTRIGPLQFGEGRSSLFSLRVTQSPDAAARKNAVCRSFRLGQVAWTSRDDAARPPHLPPASSPRSRDPCHSRHHRSCFWYSPS